MTVTTEQLTTALIHGAPVLDPREQELARTLYRLLATGSAVTDEALAGETVLCTGDARAVLDKWPGLYRDDADHIIGFWGLSVVEMPHKLTLNHTELYAWCAWDTLFLPGILHTEAQIESRDPNNHETIRLRVAPTRIIDRSHRDLVVSFVSPTERFHGDVIASFCHHVHFFTDSDSAKQWQATHKDLLIVALDDAFHIGQRWNRARGFA